VISPALEQTTRRALASGALQPIATETALIDDAGVRFVVRSASTLERKKFARERPDPLGDYERDLYVGDVPPAHYALLNKYPVVRSHILIVTRAFEHQEQLLTTADCAALGGLLAELDWLAFYNGGTAAGASQARKHLQLVPLPLAPEVPVPVPTQPLFGRLPFRHAVAPLASLDDLHAVYQDLLGRCAIQSPPYNLLATRRWMLVVPRSREHYESISVNALGFAGSLFVRNRAELERVRRSGPMNVLRAVTLESPA